MAQYLPQLMELDHYWEKAIEDAIRDAVKGKKRLLHALVTRDKLNKKIEKLIVISRALRTKQKENLKKNKINRAKNNPKKKNKKGEALDSFFKKWKGNLTAKCIESFRKLKNNKCQRKMKKRKPKKKKVIPSPLFKKKPNLKNFEKMKKSRNNFTEPMDSVRCLESAKKRRASKMIRLKKLKNVSEKKHRNKNTKNSSKKKIKKEKSRMRCGKKFRNKNKKANLKKNRISGKQNNVETIHPAKKKSTCRCRKRKDPLCFAQRKRH